VTETSRPLGSSYWKLFAATGISNLGDGVSLVAYPWLASAVTRSPLLVALIAMAQRLPWLVFTLPAGVITDRVDRRKAMVLMDGLRFLLTLVVAVAVLGQQKYLPGPKAVQTVVGTRTGLYLVLLVATLSLGMAEVLRDNSSQTMLPAIVKSDDLEKANGRMWSAESVANTFVGPPLGSLLCRVVLRRCRTGRRDPWHLPRRPTR
jgi:MFS family permease